MKTRINIKPLLLLLSIFLTLTAEGGAAQTLQGKTLLKVLDINVWSGLDYTGTLTMGAYESAAVRERRYQALVRQIKALQADIQAGAMWRLSEAEGTLAFIRETANNTPFILMGDFNAESRSLEIAALREYGMLDTFARIHPNDPGYTWDPATNLNQQKHYLNNVPADNADLLATIQALDKTLPCRIDYIFTGPLKATDSGQVTVKDSRVVMKQIIDGVHASDHYGVYTELLIDGR